MKAKKLIGVVAGAALTMSTVFGSATPVFADVAESPVIETPEQSASGEQTSEQSASGEQTSEQSASSGEQTAEQAGANTANAAGETPAVPADASASADTTTQTGAEGTQQQEAQQQGTTAVPAVNETAGSTGAGDSTGDTGAGDTAGETGTDESTGETGSDETTGGGSADTENSTTSDSTESSGENTSSPSGENALPSLQLSPLSDDEGQAGIAENSLAESEAAPASEPAFSGIEINGDFSQWDSVEKTTVDDGNIKNVAMVFDKDVYIYIKGQDVDWGTNDIATGAGVHNDGMFVLTTDTGRQLVFYLHADKNYVTDRAGNEIEGSEVYYDNATHQFEVKVPSTAIKQYKETISLGYFLEAETDENGKPVTNQDGNQVQHQIISNVADLSQSGLGTTPNEISLDGLYGDWDSYNHELIQYSTAKADAEGAMYADGENLMMHVKTYLSGQSPYLYKDITLRFNRNDNQCVNLTVVAVDSNGNVMWNTDGLYDTTAGKDYHYYLVDENAWGMGGQNIYNESTYWNWNHTEKVRWLYGEILVSVQPTGTEMEIKADMAELASRLGVDKTDLKYVQAQFENIGQQWISCAGTSTGPVPGILMGAGIAVLAAWGYKKIEKGDVSAEG